MEHWNGWLLQIVYWIVNKGINRGAKEVICSVLEDTKTIFQGLSTVINRPIFFFDLRDPSTTQQPSLPSSEKLCNILHGKLCMCVLDISLGHQNDNLCSYIHSYKKQSTKLCGINHSQSSQSRTVLLFIVKDYAILVTLVFHPNILFHHSVKLILDAQLIQ